MKQPWKFGMASPLVAQVRLKTKAHYHVVNSHVKDIQSLLGVDTRTCI